MIKLLTFDISFPPLRHLAKTRSRMTTATTFSRQTDVGLRVRTTESVLRKSLLVVVLVLECEGLYYLHWMCHFHTFISCCNDSPRSRAPFTCSSVTGKWFGNFSQRSTTLGLQPFRNIDPYTLSVIHRSPSTSRCPPP